MGKKGIGRTLGIVIATVLLVGCGGYENSEETIDQTVSSLNTQTEEEASMDVVDVPMPEQQSGQSEYDTVLDAQGRLVESRIIQEHSFSVDLNDWGEVRFVSYEPDDSPGTDPNEDVSFYLLRNKDVIYQFPYIGSEHESGYGLYYDMTFVMFMDTNGDGRKDVVIGVQYMTGAGPQGAIPHTVVRIYEDCGEFFTYQEGLSDKINEHLAWDSHVLAKDVKRLIQLFAGNEPLTNYESYSGKWAVSAGEIAAYENPQPVSRNELTCSISNGNEFDGNMFTEQGLTERIASIEGITGTIENGELFYEFMDDGWGGTGTLHMVFLPNQITVEVLDYKMAEDNVIGYGISGRYEMIRAYE